MCRQFSEKDSMEFKKKYNVSTNFTETNEIKNAKGTLVEEEEAARKVTNHTNDFESSVRKILQMRKTDDISFDHDLEVSNAVQMILAENLGAEKIRFNESNAAEIEKRKPQSNVPIPLRTDVDHESEEKDNFDVTILR